MAPKSRGFERALFQSLPVSRKLHICRSCRVAASRRGYASAAQAIAEAPAVLQANRDLPASSPALQSNYRLKAGVLLSRPPLITPDPHPFEKAYHFYQRRLNERLALPFTQYFYYKRGTPLFENWRKNKTERGGVATRDVGNYNSHTTESWHDEVLIGDKAADPDQFLEKIVDEEGRADEFVGDSGLTKTAGLKRETEADKTNNVRSLERKLSRTLYLLVREKSQSAHEQWVLPSGILENKEGLKEAAQRILDITCGPNMNTWFVARHPVGHFIGNKSVEEQESKSEKNEDGTLVKDAQEMTEYDGEKTFFMKARIFAGQADVKQATRAYEDFNWLAKEEIEKKVHPKYWSRIKSMLVAQ